MEILQQKRQITNARQELIKRKASFVESPLKVFLRRLGLMKGIAVGDIVKSWDLLLTLNFIEMELTKKSSILDIGCYASEAIVALHKLGYMSLTGVDLNPNLKDMPFQGIVKYELGDFMHTTFPDASFDAITSISVIEHGFDGVSLVREMSRLLKPNGFFIASFDYWPEKIDTTGTKFFGMDWKIFSREDIIEFIEIAEEYGLIPFGDMRFESQEKVIDCGGKNYTFGWIVLQKSE